MRRTLALLTLMLLAPGVAHAAWSGQDLGSAHTFVDDPGVIVSGERRRPRDVAVPAGARQRRPRGFEGAAARPARPASAPRSRSCRRRASTGRVTTVAGLEPYGKSGALLALIGPGAPARRRRGWRVRFGSIGGTLRSAADDPPRAGLRDRPRRRSPSIARGDAALAWFEDRGVRQRPRLRGAAPRGQGVRAAAAARHRPHPRRGGGDRRRAATRSWPGTPAACCATRFKPRGSRAASARTDTIRSEPAYFAEMRPGRHAVRARRVAWSAQFAYRGRRPRPRLRPGGDARPERRAASAARRSCSIDPGRHLRRPRPRRRRRGRLDRTRGRRLQRR